MPRVLRRREFPAWEHRHQFKAFGLPVEWPPLAANPEPEIKETVIFNEVIVPGPPVVTEGTTYRPVSQLLSTGSPEALNFGPSAGAGLAFLASALTTNEAFYIPFTIWEAITAVSMFCVNGGTVSGNVDVGLYSASGSRLVSSGSTAQAGINNLQSFDITDTILAPGRYFLALAVDNVTGTYFAYTTVRSIMKAVGVLSQATAFPLPATATFGVLAQTRLPLVGLSRRAVV